MNRSTAVLGAALAVSLLLNVVMFSRARLGSATPGAPASRSGGPAAGGVEGRPTSSAAPLAEELERERKLSKELRDTIKRLEADREVLALSATSNAPAAAAKSPTAGLREKLRKMKKLFKAAETGVQPDQEAVLEMSGEIMEVMKLGLTRGKDPKAYAEFVQACAEVALEDEAALTPAQNSEVARVTQEMADALGRITAANPIDRLIRELEVESDAVSRLQGILTSQQKEVMKKGGMDDMPTMSTGMTTTYLQKNNAADTIVKTWTQSYQLQDAQLPAARAAADAFLRDLGGIDAGLKPANQGADANWGQMTYENRVASLRAQMTALKSLEGAMTSAQLERLGTQSPREFRLMDFVTTVEVPEKK
ncbi:MAG TPA: hypothetical protein VF950_19195 [Planctomycetota bacterium]